MQSLTNLGNDGLLGLYSLFEALVPEPSCDLNHLLVQLVFEKIQLPQPQCVLA